jgi:hypothetical protein
MKNKKQIFTTLFSVLISVFLISAVAYATTTVGNDVSVGNDLTVTGGITAGTVTGATTLTLNGAAGSALAIGSVTTTGAITVGGALTTGLLTLGNSSTAAVQIGGYSPSTDLYSIILAPKPSVATAGVKEHHLVQIVGSNNGADLFGDNGSTIVSATHVGVTYGLAATFSRSTATTYDFGQTDTGLDLRVNNSATNSSGYDIQGAYIKATNTSAGTVDTIKGLDVEIKQSGIISTSATGMRIYSSDGAITTGLALVGPMTTALDLSGATSVTNEIKLKNGNTINNPSVGTIAFGSANLTNTGNITVTSGIVSAPAYQVGSGAPFTATDTPTPTQALLQQASFWSVIISSGDIDINLPAMTAGDVGRHLTFAITTAGAHAFTVTSGATTVVNLLSNAGIVAGDDAGDYIDCLITTATTATCVTYATD